MTENSNPAASAGASSDSQKPRPRNSEASKKSILWAAQAALAQKSYDEVGLREIAQEAKIDPALIIRYFGSKEGLFREVIKTHIHIDSLNGVEVAKYPEVLARLTLGDATEIDQHSMLILHRSAPSEVAGPIIRETLRERLVNPMVARLNTPDAEVRVELVLSVLGGLSTGRHVTCYPSLVSGNREQLISMMIPVFQSLLFGR